MTNWISVAERLPERGETVLIARSDGEVDTGVLDVVGWIIDEWDGLSAEVTHWMALPSPPEPPK